MAGIALPAAGALGLAAKGSVQGFDEIPDNLKSPALSRAPPPSWTARAVRSRRCTRATGTVVDLKDISPYMQKAIVAIEDSRFYQHGAIDLKGVLRRPERERAERRGRPGRLHAHPAAGEELLRGGGRRRPDEGRQATQQTLGRKVRELDLAIQLEEKLGKKKILENYLNITFFGEQAYGIEAAAQRYFSKPART